MIRRAAVGVFAVLVCVVSSLSADEVKGTVKSVNPSQSTIVLSVNGKTITYKVSKDASVVSVATVMDKKNKATEQVKSIDNGLAGVKMGATVTVLTDRVDEKEIVSSVKVSDSAAANANNNAVTPKKKKKKNNN